MRNDAVDMGEESQHPHLPHLDGSTVSIVIPLNDDYAGGGTRIYAPVPTFPPTLRTLTTENSPGHRSPINSRVSDENGPTRETKLLRPMVGQASVFQCKAWHRSEAVSSGIR